MVSISVCVGSSCHLKGSYQVIQRLRELIDEYDLETYVQLAGSFCLAGCGEGVAMRVDGTLYNVAGTAAVEALFRETVLLKLGV